MADKSTSVELSLLFKDTSNDNYFSKYSSHILASVIILFISIGIITYYKIKSKLGNYKYREDKKGNLLWPTEKCMPHILPIAGHISRLPGETTEEATYRNFEECIDEMVKTKNNEYINPLNGIIAAALAMTGTVMAGFGLILNGVLDLADYIKGKFDNLGNILSKMKTEITNILKDDIFIKLSDSYKGIYNIAIKHTNMVNNALQKVFAKLRDDAEENYFKTLLYYIYFKLLRAAYSVAGITPIVNNIFGAGNSGTGYYYKIYDDASKDLAKQLSAEQSFTGSFSGTLHPNLVGDDNDTVQLMDQQYTLFTSRVYTTGWHDYSDTDQVEFIQPMSMMVFQRRKKIRDRAYLDVINGIKNDIAKWEMGGGGTAGFHYYDYYFTRDWIAPSGQETLDPPAKSLKTIFKSYEGSEGEAGAAMSPAMKNTYSLHNENIYLPMAPEHRNSEIKLAQERRSKTPFPTRSAKTGDADNIFEKKYPQFLNRFIGTYNQLQQIKGPTVDGEFGYFSERRDKTAGLIKQLAINGIEAEKEINKFLGQKYNYASLLNKCITITYVNDTIPTRIAKTLTQLGRAIDGGGGSKDKTNQWIHVDGNKIHISKVEWERGPGGKGEALHPFGHGGYSLDVVKKKAHYFPPLYFRGYWNHNMGTDFDGGLDKAAIDANPFFNNPIWFSAAVDFNGVERKAFLFDRTKNKIEVKLGPKAESGVGEGVSAYHNGEVFFNLQIYEFPAGMWWGNKIELLPDGLRMSGGKPVTQAEAIKEFHDKKCPDATGSRSHWGRKGMDSGHMNAPFCRAFGKASAGFLTGDDYRDKEDKDMKGKWAVTNTMPWQTTEMQWINEPDVGELGIQALDPSTFSFNRKNAPGKTAWQMETADYGRVNGPYDKIEPNAINMMKNIVHELKIGDKDGPGHKASFLGHASKPAVSTRAGTTSEWYVGKTCVTTGGDWSRNSKDNLGREEEMKTVKHWRTSFGLVNSGGWGDASEADGTGPDDKPNPDKWDGSKVGQAVKFLKMGWATGLPIYPTVWSRQTEKKEAGQNKPRLFDQGMTDVCEPGWEFNLGPYEQQITLKIKNRNATYPCKMSNLTLYSQLQFCFGVDSPIFLCGNKIINIQDVRLGDVLADGSVVTNTAISEIGENIIYQMPSSARPILVSNEHKVELITFDDDGERGKQFVKSEDHPDAIKYDGYTHGLLYCISTNTSRIVINDYVFQDWNEVGAVDYYELFKYFNETEYFRNLNRFGIFHDVDVKEMIHTQLASGFWGKTPIRLHNKSVCNLDEIKIGDLLVSGERILSIIKTKCNDVTIYKHKIQGRTFYGSKNISYYPKNSLNVVDLLLKSGPVKCDSLPDGGDVLYHFLTNSGKISINGIDFAYHNRALQHILSM